MLSSLSYKSIDIDYQCLTGDDKKVYFTAQSFAHSQTIFCEMNFIVLTLNWWDKNEIRALE